MNHGEDAERNPDDEGPCRRNRRADECQPQQERAGAGEDQAAVGYQQVDAIQRGNAQPDQDETDIVAYLSALLHLGTGNDHRLPRARLFGLVDIYLRANIAEIRPAEAIAAEFGVSERTFHRIFADRETTFERHLLRLRVGLFRNLLRQPSLSDVSIAALAMQSGFADAAHATRTFRNFFGVAPRDFRSGH